MDLKKQNVLFFTRSMQLGGTENVILQLCEILGPHVGKIPIVVPRQKQFEEHVNDHPLEFARNVAERMGTIIPVEDIETLGDTIARYDEIVAGMEHGMESHNAQFNRDLERLVAELF